MSADSFKIKKSLNIEPKSSPSLDSEGDIGMNSTSHKLEVRDNAATRSIVTEDGTATLTNKTFDADGTGNSITNIENADIKAGAAIALDKLAATTASRALASDASGFVTASATTDTELGYVSGVTSAIQTQLNTKITASSTDTLTNKTFDADGTGNSITNIENADIKAGAAIALDKLAATTASRALVSDASGFVSASSVTSTTLGYLDATSSVQTQLDAKIAKSLVTTTGDMIYASGASTPARLAIGSSGQVLKTVGGVPTWATFSGGINYLSANADAESDTSGWATYADAAGTSPVDGTGGSPTTTWTRTTSSPLRGSGSFLLTKDAANRQGEGASYDFTIDSSDKAKVLTVSFDYIIGSGTFTAASSTTDSDLTIWIYDVTNSVIIQPSTIKLFSNSSTIADKYSAQFQTSSDSTSYRLIIHVGSTSASAYTVKFDNFEVGPSKYVYGTPITDWQSFTPTGSWSTNTTYTGKWRRVGDNLQVLAKVSVSGAPTSADFSLNLPSGFVIDTNKINSTTGGAESFGIGKATTGSGTYYTGTVAYNTTTSIRVISHSNNLWSSSSNIPFTWASGSFGDVFFEVPISGWSSSVQMSDNADTRVVAMAAYTQTPTGTLAASDNVVKFGTVSTDSHGGYSTSTGLYTVPVSGWYSVDAGLDISHASVAVNNAAYVKLLLDGTTEISRGADLVESTSVTELLPQTSGLVYARAGQTIGAYSYSNGTTPSYITNVAGSHLSIQKVNGPSAIAATETIAAKYTAVNTTTFTTSGVVCDWNTKVQDTHGAVTTGASWKFTAPVSGTYHIDVTAFRGGAIGIIFNLRKNGSSVQRIWQNASAETAVSRNGSTTIELNAGDYIDLLGYAESTTTTLINDATLNIISIFKI